MRHRVGFQEVRGRKRETTELQKTNRKRWGETSGKEVKVPLKKKRFAGRGAEKNRQRKRPPRTSGMPFLGTPRKQKKKHKQGQGLGLEIYNGEEKQNSDRY